LTAQANANTAPIERIFNFTSDGHVSRTLHFGEDSYETILPSTGLHANPEKDFYYSCLGSEKPAQSHSSKTRLTYLDLFCGGGGMSLGLSSGLQSLGFNPKMIGAVDLDASALSLVNAHFNPLFRCAHSVEDLISYAIDHSGNLSYFISDPKIMDPRLAQFAGKVDVLIGGPPCQGHSNLNNKTRRFDPRNLLYYIMPAVSIALDVPLVIIENVKGIESSAEDVLKISKTIFEKNGYFVAYFVLNASDYGVAQSRKRHFCIASKSDLGFLKANLDALKSDPLSFDDVNASLPPLVGNNPLLGLNSELSTDNKMRIDYLHKNSLFDLPNHVRPFCHQDGHTYPSVYGRIRPDEPVGTITTGFGSPGRGRFVHPHDARMINIREAGRLQSFPDWYWEPTAGLDFSRSNFAKIVGDAVPPLLAEAIAISLQPAFINLKD